MDNLKKKSSKEKIYITLSKVGIAAFQKIFPEYFAKEPLAPTDRYIEYHFAIKNLPKPPAKILDVGCSGSFFPLLLAAFGYETYGIDIRNYPILNKLQFDNFTFVKEDIRKTSFPDSFFDAITAISTIEHIGISGRYGESQDLSDDKKAIDEMKRILKPKGIIILTIPFGKAKIIKPYCRIYDSNLIQQRVEGLKIEKEEYYMQDSNNDWYRCSKEEVQDIDAKADKYPICLMKISKI